MACAAEPPTVLLLAGGFGLKRVDETVAMLADAVDDVQLVALAGRNEKLEKALRAVAAARPGKIVPMGFAGNMHELDGRQRFRRLEERRPDVQPNAWRWEFRW